MYWSLQLRNNLEPSCASKYEYKVAVEQQETKLFLGSKDQYKYVLV